MINNLEENPITISDETFQEYLRFLANNPKLISQKSRKKIYKACLESLDELSSKIL